jgi:hypothetical protein
LNIGLFELFELSKPCCYECISHRLTVTKFVKYKQSKFPFLMLQYMSRYVGSIGTEHSSISRDILLCSVPIVHPYFISPCKFMASNLVTGSTQFFQTSLQISNDIFQWFICCSCASQINWCNSVTHSRFYGVIEYLRQ